MTRYFLLFEGYGLVFVGHPLWREDGSLICTSCWLCQRSLSWVRVACDSRPHFTVSDLRLPFSSPPTTRRVTVEVFDPASTQVFTTLNSLPFITAWEPDRDHSLQEFYSALQECIVSETMHSFPSNGSVFYVFTTFYLVTTKLVFTYLLPSKWSYPVTINWAPCREDVWGSWVIITQLLKTQCFPEAETVFAVLFCTVFRMDALQLYSRIIVYKVCLPLVLLFSCGLSILV
jgi:hypothetical protein